MSARFPLVLLAALGLASGAEAQTPNPGSPVFGRVTVGASTTSSAGLNIPHGTAPTSPVNGDVWTSPTGFHSQINGRTARIAPGAGSAFGVPFLWSRNIEQGLSASSASLGGTGLIGFTAPYAMHDLRVVYGVYYLQLAGAGGGEVPLPNPVTWSGYLEYPIGTLTPMTFAGAQSITARAGFVQSDPVGMNVPSQSSVFARTYVQVCLPPTAAAATAGSGGSLAAATYYVKVTQICGAQGQSGASPEASVAVSASGTLTITWTPPVAWAPPAAPVTTGASSVPPTGFEIYLGTATGTETYLTTIYNPGATSYTYAGGITQGSAVSPANQVYPVGPYALSTLRGFSQPEGCNYTNQSGNGSNQAGTAGTSWESSINCYTWGAIAITGAPDQGTDVAVGLVDGDSIAYGVSDSIGQRGYIAKALLGANIPYWFAPQPGDTTTNQLLSNGQAAARIQLAAAASFDVDEMGTNDIYGGVSLATLQANQLIVWGDRNRRGATVYQTTILPRTATTDSQATTTNQYPGQSNSVTNATNASPIVVTYNQPIVASQGAPVYINAVGGNTAANGIHYACNATTPTFQLYADAACTTPVAGNGAYTSGGVGSKFWIEATRVAENTWLRCGAPIVSGAAVSCGTAGAIIAGQIGHPLKGVFDVNVNVEVNLGNVLTQNGGFWISDGTANDCTSDGTHPNGAGALNCLTLPSQAINTSLFIAP